MILKNYLLKPFPFFIHIALWLLYFSWIVFVNVYTFGWSHIPFVIGLIPIMIGIVYINRFVIRQLFLNRKVWGMVSLWGTCFLILLFGGYQLFYGTPNSFSQQILDLDHRSVNGLPSYLIDFLGFYCSFALKGWGLACVEMLFNAVQSWMEIRSARHQDVAEERKEIHIKRWISHFLGNLTQSVFNTIRKTKNPIHTIELYAVIWIRGVRIMARKHDFLIPLDEEIYYLRHLMSIFKQREIDLKITGETAHVKVLPMLLLVICKNMYKHGDFSEKGNARLHIHCTNECLTLTSTNKIAERAAWVFQKGGTGLAQLENILKEQCTASVHVSRDMEENIFSIEIQIILAYEHLQKTIEIS